jgi:DNA-directed RNA polymerase subunit K
MQKHEFSKYELARIIGARALQISMDAPLLLKINKEEMEKLQFDPVRIAEKELESNVLPISVKVPMPERKEGELKKVKDKAPATEKESESAEEEEEKDISEDAEIMELSQPEDEFDEEEKPTGREEID